ncbi:hypothetical protein NQ315_010044 [Exocentrus adspersus]|uniref:Uncharacterized protein n=1 Tax=Exocentrus adspersus TaxID=1586481 RepID=A0AAV8WB38_9CUCU|nr:hypothetical protein NQ315_010044 [Exocentrus adspersus]
MGGSTKPFSFFLRGRNEEGDNQFEGIELRLIEILAKKFNFTTDYREVTDARTVGSGEAVTRTIEKRRTNIGLGGIYTTQDRMDRIGISQWHSQDCAVFITLTSTALPRYRAIMGPFQWTVWLALTAIYLLAIFPLTFSDKHTLKTLLSNPEEMENMFWYMFGTFTNCFSFSGRNSWKAIKDLLSDIFFNT